MPVGQARNQAKQIISKHHSGIDPMDAKRSSKQAITLGEFIELFFVP